MTPSVSLSLEVAYIWAFISLRCWKRDVVGGADMALDAGSALASAPCRCACWCETAGVLFLFLNSFSEHFNTGESIPHGTGPLRSSRPPSLVCSLGGS